MLILLHSFLFVVQSAPAGSADPSLHLPDVTERAKVLVQKVLADIPEAHAAAVSTEVSKACGRLLKVLSDWLLVVKPCPPQGLTLDSSRSTNLQLMTLNLGLPTPPLLKPPSEHFTLVSLHSGVCLCSDRTVI